MSKKTKKKTIGTPITAGKKGEEIAKEFGAPVPTDVLGSYTGNAADPDTLPQQDADDL